MNLQILLSTYLTPLGKKSIRQLTQAARKPRNALWTSYLYPFRWGPDGAFDHQLELVNLGSQTLDFALTQMMYVPFEGSRFQKGRAQFNTADLDGKRKTQADFTYFANMLYLVNPKTSPSEWVAPSLRVTNGPFVVFSFEYDPPSDWDADKKFELLNTQLGYARSSKHPHDSVYGSLYRELSRFADFRGLTANWSGNKSVHLHAVFDPTPAYEGLTVALDTRFAWLEAHRRLQPIVNDLLALPIDMDKSLEQPERFRKLPNGTLRAGPKHLFGIPESTTVPLLTVFEMYRSTAGRGAVEHLITPKLLTESRRVVRPPKRARLPTTPAVDTDLHAYWTERLSELVEKCRPAGTEYPKFVSLDKESIWIAKFLADEHDTNPNVVIYEYADRTMVQGGRLPKGEVDLGMPLKHYLKLWSFQWRSRERRRSKATDEHGESANDGQLTGVDAPDTFAGKFASRAGESSDVGPREALAEIVDELLEDSGVTVLRAHEGLGKTGTIMRSVHSVLVRRAAERVADRKREKWEARRREGRTIDGRTKTTLDKILNSGSPGSFTVVQKERPWESVRLLPRELRQLRKSYALFGFDSYQTVFEKLKEFEAHETVDMKGMYLPSFTREYEDVCDALGIDKLTLADAALGGYSGFVACIFNSQPDVWREMRKRHRARTERAASAEHLVFFTVHEILQKWRHDGLAAPYANPRFFSLVDGCLREGKPLQTVLPILRKEIALDVAVHDEIGLRDAIYIDHGRDVEWWESLLAEYPDAWKDDESGLGERYRAYQAHKSRVPTSMSFETVRELHEIYYSKADRTRVAAIEEYEPVLRHPPDDRLNDSAKIGPVSLYEKSVGTEYFRKPRRWWRSLAWHTFILTTERLPILMMERQDEELRILDLDAGRRMTDKIEVRIRRTLPSGDAVRVTSELQTTYPKMTVITNRAGVSEAVTNPVLAKGSNEFADRDLAQLVFFVPPELWEQLQVVNAYYGLTTAIREYQVDGINQTAGRNLGWRGMGYRHLLVIGARLYAMLEDQMLEYLRYDYEVFRDATQRKHLRHDSERQRDADSGDPDEHIRLAYEHGMV